MTDDLALYSETILDHYEHPRHFGALPRPTARNVQTNPLCGDTIVLDVMINADLRLTDVAFSGTGCVISQASMSLLSDRIIGKSVAELAAIGPSDIVANFGVPISPARTTCALLGFRALKIILLSYDPRGA